MPAIESLLAAVVLFCGIRRAGKSNGMGVVAEELGAREVPLLLCDTEDEYGPIANRQYLPRGFLAGSPEPLHINGRMLRYIPVDVQGAERFGWQLLEEGLQLVFFSLLVRRGGKQGLGLALAPNVSANWISGPCNPPGSFCSCKLSRSISTAIGHSDSSRMRSSPCGPASASSLAPGHRL